MSVSMLYVKCAECGAEADCSKAGMPSISVRELSGWFILKEFNYCGEEYREEAICSVICLARYSNELKSMAKKAKR